MAIDFDPNTPIYLQIMQLIRQEIAAGHWSPGDKVASVRDLAIAYGVNPNTVQRALSELERDGLLYAERTAGRFVTDDQERFEKLRSELAGRQIKHFLEQMAAIGYDQEQVLRMLHERRNETDVHD